VQSLRQRNVTEHFAAKVEQRRVIDMPQSSLDDPDLTIARLVACWPQTVPVFIRHRMTCAGCVISPFHTVEDACAAYGLNQEPFMAELRRAIAQGS
jgi:hybrid cluster-associated redox disulfide protein